MGSGLSIGLTIKIDSGSIYVQQDAIEGIMSKWAVGNKCFSLRYGEGAISDYEEGLKYSVTTMHIFESKGGTRVFETEWTEEGKEYEFDCWPTLFESVEGMRTFMAINVF